jgi:hypothetical protein
MFPRDMVCLRNISVDTLHKGDSEDDDDENNNNNNNNNNEINTFPPVAIKSQEISYVLRFKVQPSSGCVYKFKKIKLYSCMYCIFKLELKLIYILPYTELRFNYFANI